MNQSQNEKLHRALDLVTDALVDATAQWAKATMQSQIKGLHGMIEQEPATAFLLICDNLHDTTCSIPEEAYILLESTGQSILELPSARSFGISRNTWESLKPQVEIQNA